MTLSQGMGSIAMIIANDIIAAINMNCYHFTIVSWF